MFIIKANIQFIDKYRQSAIRGNTYRPLLYFDNYVIRSGLIFIDNNELLHMDKSYNNRLIGIYFYKDLDYINIFKVGETFEIKEGTVLIGFGEITEVIGEA